MGSPPSLAGGDHETVADPSPGTAVTPVGAPGRAAAAGVAMTTEMTRNAAIAALIRVIRPRTVARVAESGPFVTGAPQLRSGTVGDPDPAANLADLLLGHPFPDGDDLLHTIDRSVTAGEARAAARRVADEL